MKNPVVHLELHTADLEEARGFYGALLGWRHEIVHVAGRDYHALDFGRGLGGGIVECGVPRPLWLPYVEVPDVREATERARRLGARILLGPRDGPAGRRSVIASPTGAELAFWQHKR